MSKKSIVGWVSADFTLSEHFYKNDDGVINLPGLFAIKKAAVAHSEAFWNHSGKVKKVRLTLEELQKGVKGVTMKTCVACNCRLAEDFIPVICKKCEDKITKKIKMEKK